MFLRTQICSYRLLQKLCNYGNGRGDMISKGAAVISLSYYYWLKMNKDKS